MEHDWHIVIFENPFEAGKTVVIKGTRNRARDGKAHTGAPKKLLIQNGTPERYILFSASSIYGLADV